MNNKTYRLINPYVKGSFDSLIQAKDSARAGRKFYKTLSKYFTNHVKEFNMSIQEINGGNLIHFNVREKKNGKNGIVYDLTQLDKNFSNDLEDKLISNVNNLDKQSGGKHKHKKKDNSSDSSDSSDTSDTSDSEYYNYTVPALPINKFIYYHLPYYKLVNISLLDKYRFFMPMFSMPQNPQFEIRLDLYNF